MLVRVCIVTAAVWPEVLLLSQLCEGRGSFRCPAADRRSHVAVPCDDGVCTGCTVLTPAVGGGGGSVSLLLW